MDREDGAVETTTVETHIRGEIQNGPYFALHQMLAHLGDDHKKAELIHNMGASIGVSVAEKDKDESQLITISYWELFMAGLRMLGHPDLAEKVQAELDRRQEEETKDGGDDDNDDKDVPSGV